MHWNFEYKLYVWVFTDGKYVEISSMHQWKAQEKTGRHGRPGAKKGQKSAQKIPQQRHKRIK